MSVQTPFLSGAVRITRAVVVRGVRPLTLNFPLAAVAERDQRNIKRPGALVAILRSAGVEPTGARGISAGFREFVTADVGQCC